MDQIGPNKPNWTELARLNRPRLTVWTKLDQIDQSGLNGPNGPSRTGLTKVDRMGLNGSNQLRID